MTFRPGALDAPDYALEDFFGFFRYGDAKDRIKEMVGELTSAWCIPRALSHSRSREIGDWQFSFRLLCL